ncbi:MAG TPA: hypothetical protein EYQ74_10265 [Planctomycetes bacterium]|nr:hypothetical protein [Planctomycetota bacterium]
MLRSSLISASAVILCCATANGQQQLSAHKMLGPVKDAGIFHVGTGTWTRGSGAKANLGPDVIFRSDVSSGYFGTGWEGSEGIDEGILPGLGNPNQTGMAGPRDDYLIDGAEFGYCSVSAAMVNWDFTVYDSYVPCDLPSAPSNCVNLAGALPTVALPAGGFCWVGTLDLSLGGYEICVEADGGPCASGYDGGGLGLDGFGWGATWNTTDGGTTGPFLDGHDLTWVPEGEGTVYQPAFTSCGTTSSALGTEDFFAIDAGGALSPGCYWFGGYVNNNGCGAAHNNPAGQFYMLFFTDASSGCGSDCNTVFCDTDPNNQGDVTLSTCDCSGGSIMLNLSTTFTNQFTYPLVGLGTAAVSPTGVSELCLTGSTIGRYGADAGSTGAGSYSVDLLNANSAPGGGVPTIGGSLCNGNTWRFQFWHRDGMAASRFSKGTSGTIN